jgi:hypothetical protein
VYAIQNGLSKTPKHRSYVFLGKVIGLIAFAFSLQLVELMLTIQFEQQKVSMANLHNESLWFSNLRHMCT